MKRSVNREIRTIEAMVRIYCRHYHNRDLCDNCGAMLTYAIARVEKCIFGPAKPACNNCTVHCYSSEMRGKIREIMRFSGPKMIYKHPVMAFFHFIKENKQNQQIIKSTKQ